MVTTPVQAHLSRNGQGKGPLRQSPHDGPLGLEAIWRDALEEASLRLLRRLLLRLAVVCVAQNLAPS